MSNLEGKKTLSHEVVCFRMLDFETSKLISEVSKSSGKLLLSQKLCHSVTKQSVQKRDMPKLD